MDLVYDLEFCGQAITLFSSHFECKSEEPAILACKYILQSPQRASVEEVIRDSYARFRGRYDQTSNPLILLRILLANGRNLVLRRANYQFKLCKDHSWIKYLAVSDSKTMVLGDFFSTSICCSDLQFPAFCHWVDQACGVKGMLKFNVGHLIESGFGVAALNVNGFEWLIEKNESGEVVKVQSATAAFLNITSIE